MEVKDLRVIEPQLLRPVVIKRSGDGVVAEPFALAVLLGGAVISAIDYPTGYFGRQIRLQAEADQKKEKGA